MVFALIWSTLGVAAATPDWCRDAKQLVDSGLSDQLVVQTITAANPIIPAAQVKCAEDAGLPDGVVAALRSFQESESQAASRKSQETLASYKDRPGDLVAAQAGWLQSKADSLPDGPWTVKVTVDRMEDKPIFVAYTESKDEIRGWLRVEKTPTLAIRCKRDGLDLLVVTGVLASDATAVPGTARGRARVDYNEPRSFLLAESTSMTTLFFPKAQSWLRDLEGSERLVFEFIPKVSNIAVVEFPTAGAGAVIDLARKACQQQPWLPPTLDGPQ